jgi:glycosyltransferase involved in cell wall biosynthesis
LNNDTVPLAGWLEALLGTFGRFADAGAVGGKLVYPDGRLQEAGGVIFADGSGANFGRGDPDFDAPLYSYVRAVDYCSGALLATPRALFRDLGGFDPAYRPAYYEDADYCFKVRAAGLRVYYAPDSCVIHLEGASCGTDPGAGVKRHQVLNQATFVHRWGEALATQPVPEPLGSRGTWFRLAGPAAGHSVVGDEAAGDESPSVAAHSPRVVVRVLVCAPLMPEYDREGGSRRIFDVILFLREAGYAVTFHAWNGQGGARYAHLLQQMGVATYWGPAAFEQLAAAGFDLAVVAFWDLAESLVPLLRRASPATRVVVDSIDLHFVRNARKVFSRSGTATGGGSPLAALDVTYGSEMAREINTYAEADAVLAVSQKEADLINDLVCSASVVATVPFCDDLPSSDVPIDDRRGIVFVGNFRHPPNVDAVEYLCRQVLPRVAADVAAAHPVYVVGNALSEKVRAFTAGLPNVRVVGWVPSLLPYLHRCRLAVVPLLWGAGTKGKLIQSLMAGTPVVSTSVGIEGLDLRHEQHVLVADTPEAFAASIERVARDDELWGRLARQGAVHVRETHGRAVAKARLLALVGRVLAAPSKVAGGFGAVTGEAGSLTYQDLKEELKDAVRATYACQCVTSTRASATSATSTAKGPVASRTRTACRSPPSSG